MRNGGAMLAYGPRADTLPEDVAAPAVERQQAILAGAFRVIVDESEPSSD